MRRKGSVTPVWEAAFLEALAARGVASEAARIAGTGVRNAFKRRLSSPTFAAAWKAAAELYRSEQARLALGAAGEAVASRAGGGKLVAKGQTRWSRRSEERFLDELAASASIRRAAQAAGFTTQALYRRRRINPGFAEAWDEAIGQGRIRIEAYLVEAADRSFDPDRAEAAGTLPILTVPEAIQVLKLGRAGEASIRRGPADGPAGIDEEATSALRDKILDQLNRVRERDERAKREAGWSQVGDDWVPPGWVPAADVKDDGC
jgi:hypothetical protein